MSDEPQGCLFALFRLFRLTKPEGANPTLDTPVEGGNEQELPYRRRDDFLSPAELSFYHVLCAAVGEQYTICPKVGLDDLFFVPRSQESTRHLNRIARKHVDFLLCDPHTLQPVRGIELDDASHQLAQRVERDRLVEQVFAAAGLPLTRIPVQASYSVTEVWESVLGQHAPQPLATPSPLSPPVDSPPSTPVEEIPLCPKCGVPMLLRTAQRGDRIGQQFYGCPNYPKCRQVINCVTAQDQ